MLPRGMRTPPPRPPISPAPQPSQTSPRYPSAAPRGHAASPVVSPTFLLLPPSLRKSCAEGTGSCPKPRGSQQAEGLLQGVLLPHPSAWQHRPRQRAGTLGPGTRLLASADQPSWHPPSTRKKNKNKNEKTTKVSSRSSLRISRGPHPAAQPLSYL